MFPKSKRARFNETIDFIQNRAAAGLTQGIRNDIAALISLRINRLSPAAIQAYDTANEAMSVKRHIALGVATGTNPERETRRAISLLWSTLAATQAFPPAVQARIDRAMMLAPGNLQAEFDDVMLKAAVVASGAGASHVFNMQFSANPLTFIQTHRLFINGSTAGKATFTNSASTHFRNLIQFDFFYNAEHDRFEFACGVSPNHGASHQVMVASVPALHWSEVPGRGIAPLPTALAPAGFHGVMGTEVAGAQWMLTTQFTGCSFCYSTGGGFLYAAHISPAGIMGLPVMTGAELANQLMGNVAHVARGRFANFPGGAAAIQNVFGNGVGNAAVNPAGIPFYPPKTPGAVAGQMKWMSIFGRRHVGNWQLYTQSIDGVDAILEARRIM